VIDRAKTFQGSPFGRPFFFVPDAAAESCLASLALWPVFLGARGAWVSPSAASAPGIHGRASPRDAVKLPLRLLNKFLVEFIF
jgi:hypothetical protein